MHTQKKKRLIKTVLSMAIIAGAAGAATGTYAWYSYQKEVNTELRGTTIKADKEIQIGLRWNANDSLGDFMEIYNHGEFEVQTGVTVGEEECNIYWIRGNYVSDILKTFQEKIGSAQANLEPITAGVYSSGDLGDGENGEWTGFKMTPASETPATVTDRDYKQSKGPVTDMNDYFFLPLAFRVMNTEPDDEGNLYAEGQNIFLSKFISKDLTLQELKDQGSLDDGTEVGKALEKQRQKEIKVDLSKAIRTKVDYPSHATKSDNFIFNPNAIDDDYRDLNTGNENLPVGGILNIQKDNMYDYDLSTKKEIAYGYFDNEVKYIDQETSNEEPVKNFDDCDTFHAGHLRGGYQIDFDQTTPSICHINKSIVNEKRKVYGEDLGAVEGDRQIVKTDTNRIGYVDLSIYVEGWDKNVVNETAGREFSIELEFSIA